MRGDENLIARLEAEHEELQLTRFGFEEAWAIGQELVAAGRRDALPIAIDISLNGQGATTAPIPVIVHLFPDTARGPIVR